MDICKLKYRKCPNCKERSLKLFAYKATCPHCKTSYKTNRMGRFVYGIFFFVALIVADIIFKGIPYWVGILWAIMFGISIIYFEPLEEVKDEDK